MRFFQYDSALEFEEKAKPFLNGNEDLYSLFSGVLQGIIEGHYDNALMVTIEKQERVVALFQMTPPHPLNMIILEGTEIDDIITFAVGEFLTRNLSIPSVVGMKNIVHLFADKWQGFTRCETKLLMNQGLYRLDEVAVSLEKSPGSWRYAREDEAPFIETWFQAFEIDTGLKHTPPNVIKGRVAQFLQDQEVFFWENKGKVVSMMKKARPTEHGVTISFVYTPQEERNKGYARTMVAICSEELLKLYDFCVLYTDMLNPTSNKIYQEIGYKKIADTVHVEFLLKERILVSKDFIN